MGSDQKRAILAVVLSGIVLFSWQAFFAPKVQIEPPKQVAKEANVITTKPNLPTTSPSTTEPNVVPVDASSLVNFSLNKDTESVKLDNALSISDFSSRFNKLNFQDILGSTTAFQVTFLDEKNNEVPQLFNVVNETASSWEGQSVDGSKVIWSLRDDGRRDLLDVH